MTIFALVTMFMTRMFGLFLLFPVFMISARDYPAYSPLLAGLAIGAYGLTQALFQVPYGALSDRYGRKLVLGIGFFIFSLGSFIGVYATTMYHLLIARIVQGCGAVSAIILALASDSTSANHRPLVFLFFGLSIGFAFIISLSVAPLLVSHIGLSGIFLITAILSLVCIFLLFCVNSNPSNSMEETIAMPQIEENSYKQSFHSACISIAFLHGLLTIIFTRVPVVLLDMYHIPLTNHTYVYLAVLVVSTFPVYAIIRKPVLLAHWRKVLFSSLGIFVLTVPVLLLGTFSFNWYCLFLVVFFTGFSLLEGFLPHISVQVIPKSKRGALLGVYSTCQFFGAFIGGVLGGLGSHYLSIHQFTFGLFVLLFIWLFVLLLINNLGRVKLRLLRG
ncbi:MAG: MFS transporter [Methylacidiphilales bacterium]|nr:MFS transporter [Candidatus Methylacidiphilales bacterium]